MKTLFEQMVTTLRSKKGQGSQLYVACSGGIDSMVLLHMLSSVRQALPGIDVVALHVNYGLRGEESDQDQGLVQSFAESLGIRVQILDLRELDKPVSGIQEWARLSRFRWMESVASKPDDIVALGHHRGDLAENVLFRMSRGTHRSLGGLKEWTGKYWRPLLEADRQAIQFYASGQNVPYREDSSNAKIIYSRNRIRHLVLPELERLFGGAGKRIADTASDIDQLLSYLDEQFEHISHGEVIRWEDISHLIEPLGRRVISAYLHQNDCSVEREQLRWFWTALQSGGAKTFETAGPNRVVIGDGRLRLDRKHSSPARRSQYERHLEIEEFAVVPPGGTVLIRREAKTYSLFNEGDQGLKTVIKTT